MEVSSLSLAASFSFHSQETRVSLSGEKPPQIQLKEAIDRYEMSVLTDFSFNEADQKRLESTDPDELMAKMMSDPKAIEENWFLMLHEFNPKQEKKLRALLQQIDRENELQEILFGKNSKKMPKEEMDFEELNFSFRFEISVSGRQSQRSTDSSQNYMDLSEVEFSAQGGISRKEADPLVFDLSGDGIETTGIEKGIHFDINGDGKQDQTSFVSGDDYALALDRDRDGRISSGKELFGDLTGSKDGIEELSRFDSNLDMKIDASDEVWSQLRLVNAGRNVITMDQAGIESVDLTQKNSTGFTSQGDRFDGALSFSLKDGQQREAKDVWFNYRVF